jgi:hypothetical protein
MFCHAYLGLGKHTCPSIKSSIECHACADAHALEIGVNGKKRHLQLSHPSCRTIPKSIETLRPVWEQAKSRTAAFAPDSDTFRFLAKVTYSNELIQRETVIAANFVFSSQTSLLHYTRCIVESARASTPFIHHESQASLHTVTCMPVNQHISIVKWSHHISRNDHYSLCVTSQPCTRSKCRVALYAPQHLHATKAAS